jgi:UDP-N-acetylmuramoylalanine--D-glutamate ligase
VLASLAAGLACGASPESMSETIERFRGVEHRMELVDEIDGVKFYNDSKATSVDATLKALEALDEDGGKVILILGGRGKNAPYAPLAELVERKVRVLIVLGEDADNIELQLKNSAEIVRVGSIDEAAAVGLQFAESRDSVLLAPACASFDMFKGFEERGEVFKKAVEHLKTKTHANA